MSLRVRQVGTIAAALLTIATANPIFAVETKPAQTVIAPIILKGYEQLKKADVPGAVKTFSDAVRQNQNDALARRCLAYALLCNGSSEEALQQLILLTRLVPTSASDWCTFGEVYLVAGSYQQAEDAFNDALKQKEDLFWARAGIIRAKAMQRDFKAAYQLTAELIADTQDQKMKNYLYQLRLSIRRLELSPAPIVAPRSDLPGVTPEELNAPGKNES